MADDVGSEVLQCYGGQSYRTPQLDQLARDGMRFDHAYSMAACHPTRISLLSGQYPFRLGQPGWGTYPKEAENTTVAHALKAVGYRTAIAGKWQLTLLANDPAHPRRLGFEESCLFGWHEGPRYYRPRIWENGKLRDDVENRFGPDVFCDFLIDFITHKHDQPFFAYYSMALCHDVTDDLDAPVPTGPNGRYQNFPEMVSAMDQRVGRILDALDGAGLGESTLVIFYSDNGTPSRTIIAPHGNEFVYQPNVSRRNGRDIPGGKTLLTDSGTRVPLIARWPAKIRAGKLSNALVDVSDFLPTFAELADARLPSKVQLDGRSFASQLYGNGQQVRDWVFAEHKGRSFLKNRKWKLYNDGEFFDMKNDPEEKQPLDTSDLIPETEKDFRNLLDAHKSLAAGSG